MSKLKASKRAKANSLKKAARKRLVAKQAKADNPAEQFNDAGEIRSAFHAAGGFKGAKAKSSH